MGHDEHQSSSSLDCFPNIGDSNDILGKLNSREVLFVLMVLVDDFRQFSSFKLIPSACYPKTGVNETDILFKYPNLYFLFKEVRVFLGILTCDPSNGRTPILSAFIFRARGKRLTNCPIR